MLIKLMRNMKGIFRDFSSEIANFALAQAAGQAPSNQAIHKVLKFQSAMLTLDFSKAVEPHLIAFIHNLQKKVIEDQGYDAEVKANAIQFYLQLGPNFEALAIETFEGLVQNINVVCKFPQSLQLLNRIVPTLNSAKISQLFFEILNCIEPAKHLILQVILQQKQ